MVPTVRQLERGDRRGEGAACRRQGEARLMIKALLPAGILLAPRAPVRTVTNALLALLALVAAAAVPAQAGQAPERRAILGTVQRFFDALAARDQAAIMAEVIPEGRITSHRVRDGRVVV